jgi:PKD repeat protein
MYRRFAARTAALVVLIVALAAPSAQAYDFTVNPNPPNEDQVTTFTVVPTPPGSSDIDWDLNGPAAPGFVEGTNIATHTYTSAGAVTVRVRVNEPGPGGSETVTKQITVNGAPGANFVFLPGDPLAGESVSFTPLVVDPEGDSVTLTWNFGDGSLGSGTSPSHAYATAGTYPVVLTATDLHGAATTQTNDVVIGPDPGPAAGFEFSPQAPLTGDSITFKSISAPSQGSITATDWDLNGDNVFTDALGGEVTAAFAAAGDHLVQMRVTQTNGLQGEAFDTVAVSARPSQPITPGSGTGTPAPSPKPARMRPFPVVRIAGVVLPRGALIRVLSVRLPRGAQVLVRCSGRGCPARQVAKASAMRLLRFPRFERRLPAGVKLELFVRKAGRIGKYTRFTIRAGKAPARVDRCLMPGRPRPVRCP